MRKLAHLILALIIVSFVCQKADAEEDVIVVMQQSVFESVQDTIRLGHYRITISNNNKENQRKCSKLIAIGADILTGPLGGHRIYMGTEPWVPVVYALTLGGGFGFLPVTDLFVIIFTRDISKYCDNPQIIMWL